MKVSKKKRRGRKKNPQPHGSHRTIGAPGDPVTRRANADYRRRRAEVRSQA